MSKPAPDAPEGWEHTSGRLREVDGGRVTYTHKETGIEAYCEAMVEPDNPHLVFRPSLMPAHSAPFIEYPKKISVGHGHDDPRQAALDQLFEWMDEYPEADDVDARGYVNLGAEKQAAENNPYNRDVQESDNTMTGVDE